MWYKKISSFFFVLFIAVTALNAQILDPVKWEVSSTKIDNSTFEVLYKAKIGKGWHLYSQFLESNEGPIPTAFNVAGSGDN